MAGTPPPVEEGVSVPSPPDGYRNLPVSAPQPHMNIPGLPSLPDGGILVVDTGFLARAAQAAHDAAAAASNTADSLSSAIHRSGPTPWGDDPGLGQAFGEVFARPRRDLEETVLQLPSLLENLADSLHATRRVFLKAEDSARTSAEDLARSMSSDPQPW